MGDEVSADNMPFAVVAIGFRQNSDSEQRTFAFVHALVKPALECLRRELMARDEILNLHSSLLEQDNDLEMLLSVSGGGPDAKPESAADLKDIVASATEHLQGGTRGADHSGEAVSRWYMLRPMRRSIPRCSPRRIATCCRWHRCAARPSIVNRMVLQAGSQ